MHLLSYCLSAKGFAWQCLKKQQSDNLTYRHELKAETSYQKTGLVLYTRNILQN